MSKIENFPPTKEEFVSSKQIEKSQTNKKSKEKSQKLRKGQKEPRKAKTQTKRGRKAIKKCLLLGGRKIGQLEHVQ